MEKQVRSIYTNEKFLEFQMELTKKTYCEVIDVVGDSPVLTYHIQEEKWIPKPKEKENAFIYKVSFQKDDCKFECSCHNFEFRGIVCRHVIMVYICASRKIPSTEMAKRCEMNTHRYAIQF
ncbi:hypothetical protein MKW98_020932 [Papaver atlanticum]|uniref:Protein FAR1-RELATED SEQUENCE n=1 Tax=Papaver atlanticum TaxID=357466 RepID=A0AAD4TCP8_9MAGN|nr:hypothetical protein MKW98_020932 [Papaver atlanticum]